MWRNSFRTRSTRFVAIRGASRVSLEKVADSDAGARRRFQRVCVDKRRNDNHRHERDDETMGTRRVRFSSSASPFHASLRPTTHRTTRTRVSARPSSQRETTDAPDAPDRSIDTAYRLQCILPNTVV